MTNKEITRVLYDMAALYEMEGILFKPRAYEKAALSVESLGEEIAELYKREGTGGLTRISGVGRGIADHIEHLILGKHFSEYERLKKKNPVDISGLTAIEGVGPRMVRVLWKKLKIKNVNDLEKAARAGKIRRVPRFGVRSEDKILRGIDFLKKFGGKKILGFILSDVRNFEKKVQSFPEVTRAVVAGSIRRMKETIGDIDVLASSSDPLGVMDRFLALPEIAHVYAKGKTKTMVKLKNGLDADLRVIPQESFGAALNYFTGSKDHNVALREIAIKKKWKLNEYGLFRGGKMIAGGTEEELYRVLGLHYIEAEMRENIGEIAVARRNQLPNLIGYNDLQGDLQVQTDWTDGENSIEEMARAAIEAGLQYIAITDHTRSLAMTGGADEKKLLMQMAEIDRINRSGKFKNFMILKGAEVNIGKDGELDIDDVTLKKLDVAGAAVHSHFNLSRGEQTERIIRAMENPHIDVIFHLTGRVIGKRPAIDVDVDTIIAAAKRTGTVLEIDAFPDRLDIRDEYIRKCAHAGVKMSIDSDAHSIQHFKYLEIGIGQARRGWAEKKDIVNAWPVERMRQFLK